MLFGLWTQMGPRNHVLDGIQVPMWRGNVEGDWRPIVKYRDFLAWAMQKRLNRSRCRLGCGLGWSKGSRLCIKWGAHWRHLTNTTKQFMYGSDAAFLSNYFDHLFYVSYSVLGYFYYRPSSCKWTVSAVFNCFGCNWTQQHRRHG